MLRPHVKHFIPASNIKCQDVRDVKPLVVVRCHHRFEMISPNESSSLDFYQCLARIFRVHDSSHSRLFTIFMWTENSFCRIRSRSERILMSLIYCRMSVSCCCIIEKLHLLKTARFHNFHTSVIKSDRE
jgi:hypothetical protein